MFELESLKEVQNQFENWLTNTKGDEADEQHTETCAETQGDQGRPKRTTNPPVWLKDYVTVYAYITEEHEPCTYREAYGDGTAISFSVYKTTYAPAPTSGSAHHTFGLAHQYKAAASASPCFRTSYSSASARSTESTTIGYSMAYVYGTGREAGIGRETGQDGFGSSTGWIYRR
ncbi:hypothetical protein NE237_001883 [Protea cynaroides]|uniref:Uncharacterized protein n=1 Tax=Protea cynaroides TaxID=273540 RepID=A0A9Q0KTY0_9MAGN|nr:hypothetical protein NE237_001883 [Protea cynaroides]